MKILVRSKIMISTSRIILPSAPPFDEVQITPQSPPMPPPSQTMTMEKKTQPRKYEKYPKTMRTVLLLCIFFCVVQTDTALTSVYFDAFVLEMVDCHFGFSGMIGDILIIVIGLHTVTVAYVGFHAAYRNNIRKLESYKKMISTNFKIQIIGSIVIAIHRYCLANNMKNCLHEGFGNDHGQGIHNKTWNFIQATFTCCGFVGPADYLTMDQPISPSCCPKEEDYATECLNSESYYMSGCEEIINLMHFAYGGLLLLSAAIIVGLETYCKHLSTRIINEFKMEPAKFNVV